MMSNFYYICHPLDTKKSVQFNEEVIVEQFDPNSVRIDESVIDQALDLIQNADPTGLTEDSQEMLNLEGTLYTLWINRCLLPSLIVKADVVSKIQYLTPFLLVSNKCVGVSDNLFYITLDY